MVSRIIKNQDITNGAPDGRNKSTNFVLCNVNATKFKPIKEVKLKQKVVKAKLVNVNVYGIIPNILQLKIRRNKNTKYDV